VRRINLLAIAIILLLAACAPQGDDSALRWCLKTSVKDSNRYIFSCAE
jgi:hypothetical protein